MAEQEPAETTGTPAWIPSTVLGDLENRIVTMLRAAPNRTSSIQDLVDELGDPRGAIETAVQRLVGRNQVTFDATDELVTLQIPAE
jgi:hypothetical protein